MTAGRTEACGAYRWANRAIGWALAAALLMPIAIGRVSMPCAQLMATGTPCASCGLTRALAALYRGDLSLSLAYHPAGVVFVALASTELAARWLVGRRVARCPGIPWGDIAQLVSAVLLFDAALRWGAPLRKIG